MSDEADQAQATMESLHEHMLAASRKPVPVRTGHCLYCEAPVHEEALFCDTECHKDYEHEQSIRAKQTATKEFFGGGMAMYGGTGEDSLRIGHGRVLD